MITITKDEKDIICERFPYVHIVRTMKQKSKRHRYYCEESSEVLKYLKNVSRSGRCTTNTKEDGTRNEFRKTARRNNA